MQLSIERAEKGCIYFTDEEFLYRSVHNKLYGCTKTGRRKRYNTIKQMCHFYPDHADEIKKTFNGAAE